MKNEKLLSINDALSRLLKSYFDSHCEERSDEAISFFVSDSAVEIASPQKARLAMTRESTFSEAC